MATAERHNQLRAHALAVLVMDHLRGEAAQQRQVTLWSLNAAICERYAIRGREARNAQYAAVRTVVRNLENAGMIGSRKEWQAEGERYIKILWPCSV